VCSGGSCSGSCTPNSYRCSGTTQPQTCNASGEWVAYGSACSGSCETCTASATSASCTSISFQSDPNNCGTCGYVCRSGMGCSAGVCVCTASSANGTPCTRPGGVVGTCWSGACVLPAYFSGCSTEADCVPGGCTGAGGYCIGAVDVAGEVSCTSPIGSYVVCSTSEGCSPADDELVQCGDGSGGTGNVTCDGPSDCPENSDCCAYPGSGQVAHCVAETTPGVIGSGCPSEGPGSQLPNLCDPSNPTSSCPTGKTCQPTVEEGFSCE
jgi:hypothetical protein